ncbi:hypothetical protein D1007_30608 [Hordeum vulgare]|nr:hypothetical protein D1007_30608 [Hordeum vulgare]
MRKMAIEPTPCPDPGEPREENEDENAYLKKGLKFSSLPAMKVWLSDYAIRNHMPFYVDHSDINLRFTVKCVKAYEGCIWKSHSEETADWIGEKINYPAKVDEWLQLQATKSSQQHIITFDRYEMKYQIDEPGGTTQDGHSYGGAAYEENVERGGGGGGTGSTSVTSGGDGGGGRTGSTSARGGGRAGGDRTGSTSGRGGGGHTGSTSGRGGGVGGRRGGTSVRGGGGRRRGSMSARGGGGRRRGSSSVRGGVRRRGYVDNGTTFGYLVLILFVGMSSSGSMTRPPCTDQWDMPKKWMAAELDNIKEKDVPTPSC